MSRYASLLAVCLLVACSAEKPTERVVHDNIHRIDLIIEHALGPALSSSEDRVYANTTRGRELIFEGYGASRIAIKPLQEGVLIVEYCGGSIRKVASFLSNRSASGEAVAVKVQPVIIANVSVSGNRMCTE